MGRSIISIEESPTLVNVDNQSINIEISDSGPQGIQGVTGPTGSTGPTG